MYLRMRCKIHSIMIQHFYVCYPNLILTKQRAQVQLYPICLSANSGHN